MARTSRLVSLGQAHHITQRGNNRELVFFDDADRHQYLTLLRTSAAQAGLRVLAYCLMPNHTHWIAIPLVPTSLAEAFGRAHGHYAQHLNRRRRRSGHLWQNRFYSCPLRESHLWFALRYVELNPVRAGLAADASAYEWSSAQTHLGSPDRSALLDQHWWMHEGQQTPAQWHAVLHNESMGAADDELRRATRTGRCFGEPTPPGRGEAVVGERLTMPTVLPV